MIIKHEKFPSRPSVKSIMLASFFNYTPPQFYPIKLLDSSYGFLFTAILKNSLDPDQLASQKPADLDLPFSSKQDISGFSMVTVKNQCCLFVNFVALRPKSTAMVMAGRSVHRTTIFLGKLEQAVLFVCLFV